jgi:hypothetical protein
MPPLPPSPNRQTGAVAPGASRVLVRTKPKPQQPSWQTGEVTLTIVKPLPKFRKVVKAKLLGHLAVHAEALTTGPNPKAWTVSSAPTGLHVVTVDGEADALRIGELLHAEAGAAFTHEDPTEVLAELPQWLYQWVRACRVARAWVDHRAFKEAGDATGKG